LVASRMQKLAYNWRGLDDPTACVAFYQALHLSYALRQSSDEPKHFSRKGESPWLLTMSSLFGSGRVDRIV